MCVDCLPCFLKSVCSAGGLQSLKSHPGCILNRRGHLIRLLIVIAAKSCGEELLKEQQQDSFSKDPQLRETDSFENSLPFESVALHG